MLPIALAVVTALLIWWLSTGLILYLDGLGRATFPRSMAVATVVLAGALYGIVHFRDDASAGGAFAAFACSVAVWGWIEMSFLLGYLTGPRRHACEPGCRGVRHFGHAIEALLWHELAIIALAVVVFALDAPGRTHVASATLLTLWLLRESAKLNLFLGVRNSGAELLPAHLGYLRAYFRYRPMNALFPFSILAASVALTMEVRRLFAAGASDFQVTSSALLATLIALGIIEHWILVLPLSPGALWHWSLRSREAPG